MRNQVQTAGAVGSGSCGVSIGDSWPSRAESEGRAGSASPGLAGGGPWGRWGPQEPRWAIDSRSQPWGDCQGLGGWGWAGRARVSEGQSGVGAAALSWAEAETWSHTLPPGDTQGPGRSHPPGGHTGARLSPRDTGAEAALPHEFQSPRSLAWGWRGASHLSAPSTESSLGLIHVS